MLQKTRICGKQKKMKLLSACGAAAARADIRAARRAGLPLVRGLAVFPWGWGVRAPVLPAAGPGQCAALGLFPGHPAPSGSCPAAQVRGGLDPAANDTPLPRRPRPAAPRTTPLAQTACCPFLPTTLHEKKLTPFLLSSIVSSILAFSYKIIPKRSIPVACMYFVPTRGLCLFLWRIVA